jgi:branched-chain amino acid aminotransferase
VVGEGKRGSVTTVIQHSFFDYVQGRVEDRFGWMTPVKAGAGRRLPVADR